MGIGEKILFGSITAIVLAQHKPELFKPTIETIPLQVRSVESAMQNPTIQEQMRSIRKKYIFLPASVEVFPEANKNTGEVSIIVKANLLKAPTKETIEERGLGVFKKINDLKN